MPKGRTTPSRIIARALAARELHIRYKVIAAAIGVSVPTVKDWCTRRTRADIVADPQFRELFDGLFR